MTEMRYHPEGYTELEWLEAMAYTKEPNRRALMAAIAILGMPESFLDLGCGDGTLVEFMAKLIPSWFFCRGVDKVQPQNDRCIKADLMKPLPSAQTYKTGHIQPRVLADTYEMVISWEVGQHLPLESSAIYCDNLTRFTGKWLVFTAAIPGQGGDFHINEQQPEFWRGLLEERELTYHPDITEILRDVWKTATGPCTWLPQNLQVFERVKQS